MITDPSNNLYLLEFPTQSTKDLYHFIKELKFATLPLNLRFVGDSQSWLYKFRWRIPGSRFLDESCLGIVYPDSQEARSPRQEQAIRRESRAIFSSRKSSEDFAREREKKRGQEEFSGEDPRHFRWSTNFTAHPSGLYERLWKIKASRCWLGRRIFIALNVCSIAYADTCLPGRVYLAAEELGWLFCVGGNVLEDSDWGFRLVLLRYPSSLSGHGGPLPVALFDVLSLAGLIFVRL